MGFERLVRTLQGKTSNYDTDVFQPIIKAIAEMAGTAYGQDNQKDIAMRVIADHIRTIAFSITDGQLPSNAYIYKTRCCHYFHSISEALRP